MSTSYCDRAAECLFLCTEKFDRVSWTQNRHVPVFPLYPVDVTSVSLYPELVNRGLLYPVYVTGVSLYPASVNGVALYPKSIIIMSLDPVCHIYPLNILIVSLFLNFVIVSPCFMYV